MKYRLKEHSVGEKTSKDGINYTVDDVNPDTNQVSWKVDYEPDFITVYNQIDKALKEINDVRVRLDDGSKFNDVMSAVENAKYAFRKVLKKDYPKQYQKLLRGNVNEISTSGGAGPIQSKIKTYKLGNGKI